MRTSTAQELAAIREFTGAQAVHDRDHVACDAAWTMPRDCTAKASCYETGAQPGGHHDGDGHVRIDGHQDPVPSGAGPTQATTHGGRR